MTTKQKIVYLYFIILPFIDLITSLMTRFTDLPLSLGMVIKGITFIFGIMYILLFSKSKYRKLSIIYLIILAIFAILYFVTKIDILSIGNIFNELILAFKYLYFPVMLISVINIFEDFEIDNNLIKKILLINLIFYACLMLIPFLTGTNFGSYRYNGVDGANGWFYAANETGAIITILLSSLYLLMDNKNKKKILISIPLMLPLALMGTKVSYLGLIIIVAFVSILFIINNVKEKDKKNIIVLPIFLIIFTAIVCNISPTIENLEDSIERNNKLEENKKDPTETKKDEFKYEKLEDLIDNEIIVKIVKVSLNQRDSFFLMNYSIYEDASLNNKLFGLSWSDREKLNYTFEKKLIEVDYLDIFIHYGIIGFIIYFMPLLYFVVTVLKRIKKKDYETWFYLLVLFLGLAVSSLAGHVLSAPAVSIYLVLICAIINNNINERILKK